MTVKAIAEMLRLPAYKQARILHEQKYPKQQPQIFRTPYYQPALSGIVGYYQNGNKANSLISAKSKIESISQSVRRQNNLRVIERFEKSSSYGRLLVPKTNVRIKAAIGTVELRLSPDFRAAEGAEDKTMYLNCRGVKLDDETARLTVEIAHWVYTQNKMSMDPVNIEFVDLFSGQIHRYKKPRASTLKLLKDNVKIIETLWPTL